MPLKSPPGSSLHDLTWTLIDPSGRVLRKELNKRVVSTDGKWALIAYLFEEYDPTAEVYREPRIALVRYQRKGLIYTKKRHFTASAVQCAHLIDLFAEWLGVTEKVGKLIAAEPSDYPELPVSPLLASTAAPVSTPLSASSARSDSLARSAAAAPSSTPPSPAAPSEELMASDAAASPASD